MHLWAAEHGWLDDVAPSRLDQHLMEQGNAVEMLAQQFLHSLVQESPAPLELAFQKTVTDRHFLARLDAVVFDPTEQAYDIYEIKSSSSVKKEDFYDAAFQRLVAEAKFRVRHFYLLHVNKTYTRKGDLQIDDMFQLVNIDQETEAMRQEVTASRKAAWQTANLGSPDGVQECLKPKTCPCPRLCHPNLPPQSIFEIPRLGSKKTRQLKSSGVLAIQDIPTDFPLTDKQRAHSQAVKSGKPLIQKQQIRKALSHLDYPLYFLDYEAFNPAVPMFDGYRPYEYIVFQYSLDIFETIDAKPVHHEFLFTDTGDPAPPLLEHLLPRIDNRGSVIVWYKPFEATRNREMAERYPHYAGQIENINDRIFDLMEIFSKGYFIHPEFHGSSSIKAVLPVLAEEMNYAELPIPQGDEAMIAWVEMVKGNLSPEEVEETRKELLRYCALDTMAMVKIWQALMKYID